MKKQFMLLKRLMALVVCLLLVAGSVPHVVAEGCSHANKGYVDLGMAVMRGPVRIAEQSFSVDIMPAIVLTRKASASFVVRP